MTDHEFIRIVFDGPPSHESGRFIEVENEHGESISFGEWIEGEDGLWYLQFPNPETMLNEHAKLKRVRDYVEERWKESPESEKVGGYTILKNADVIALLADTQEQLTKDR